MPMTSDRTVTIVVCTPDEQLNNRVSMCMDKYVSGCCKQVMKYADTPKAMLEDKEAQDFDVLLIDTGPDNAQCLELAQHYREIDPGFVLMLLIDRPEDALAGYPLKAFRCPRKASLFEDLEECASDLLNELGIGRDTVEFQAASKLHQVYIDEILYVEYRGPNMVLIHSREKNRKPVPVFDSIDDIDMRLEPRGFCRIHQSYSINMAFLADVTSTWAVMVNGDKLPVSHNIHHDLRVRFLTGRSGMK